MFQAVFVDILAYPISVFPNDVFSVHVDKLLEYDAARSLAHCLCVGLYMLYCLHTERYIKGLYAYIPFNPSSQANLGYVHVAPFLSPSVFVDENAARSHCLVFK